jgi:hypothetical protein
MLCCQTSVITFHSIKQSVSSVIKIMYMKCQPLCCVKNPKSFIFSFQYSKQVPMFLFKIYTCSLWKTAETNNEMWLSTGWPEFSSQQGQGLSSPSCPDQVWIHHPFYPMDSFQRDKVPDNSSPSSGRLKNKWSFTYRSSKCFYDMAQRLLYFYPVHTAILNHSQNWTTKL